MIPLPEQAWLGIFSAGWAASGVGWAVTAILARRDTLRLQAAFHDARTDLRVAEQALERERVAAGPSAEALRRTEDALSHAGEAHDALRVRMAGEADALRAGMARAGQALGARTVERDRWRDAARGFTVERDRLHADLAAVTAERDALRARWERAFRRERGPDGRIVRADRVAADAAHAGDGQAGSQVGVEGSPAGDAVRMMVGSGVEFAGRPDASGTIMAVSAEAADAHGAATANAWLADYARSGHPAPAVDTADLDFGSGRYHGLTRGDGGQAMRQGEA